MIEFAPEMSNLPKVYLIATGINKFEWVDKPEKATAVADGALGVTWKQSECAELAQAPKKTEQHEPGWIISMET